MLEETVVVVIPLENWLRISVANEVLDGPGHAVT